MNILSQRNPKWSDVKLGSSHLSIGKYGCTTCCLAMINNKFGANCTPDQVAKHVDWYTKTGLILWNKLNMQHAIFDWRGYGQDTNRINQYLSDPINKAVILQLEITHRASPPSFHWVIAENYQGGTFTIADPWLGVECKNTLYGPVVGAAYFTRRV